MDKWNIKMAVQGVNKQIPEHYSVHFPKMIVGDNEHTKSYKWARA